MDSNNWDRNKRNNCCHHGFGRPILLIVIGVVFLVINLNIIPALFKPILISWQMLLVAIGIWSLLKRNYVSGIILVVIGTVFIIPVVNRVFPELGFPEIDLYTYWPLILIFVGLLILFFGRGGSFKNREKHDGRSDCDRQTHSYDNSHYIDRTIVFGGVKQIVLSQEFEGGEVNVVFGGMEIDLRKAKLYEMGASLELNVVFGGITVFVPQDWNVIIKSESVFGGFVDQRNLPDNFHRIENKPLLYLNASCVFGGGEIKC